MWVEFVRVGLEIWERLVNGEKERTRKEEERP
jgi:hypothetical protein